MKKNWICLGLDIHELIARYASYLQPKDSEFHLNSGQITLLVKKIQLCSNVEVREIVTSDVPLSKDVNIPKVTSIFIFYFLNG